MELLPDTQTPSWLGLPNNAERVLLTTQGGYSVHRAPGSPSPPPLLALPLLTLPLLGVGWSQEKKTVGSSWRLFHSLCSGH